MCDIVKGKTLSRGFWFSLLNIEVKGKNVNTEKQIYAVNCANTIYIFMY